MARRSGLGRGLGALLGETAGEVLSNDIDTSGLQQMPIDRIVPNPDQPRRSFDDDELEQLADSVRRDGILQPLVVRPQGETYQIVAGERRWHAARRVGLESVPVVVRQVGDDEVLRLALVENLQRSDLNPLETARGYRELMNKMGLTQEELGVVLSKSRSSVANTLRLLDLPEEVQDMVGEGKLTAGHARAILMARDEQAMVALAHKVVDEGLSVRQTEILGPLVFVSGTKERQPRQGAPSSYKQAARTLRNNLSTRVQVRTVRGRNKIEIEFADEQELEKLVRRIVGD